MGTSWLSKFVRAQCNKPNNQKVFLLTFYSVIRKNKREWTKLSIFPGTETACCITCNRLKVLTGVEQRKITIWWDHTRSIEYHTLCQWNNFASQIGHCSFYGGIMLINVSPRKLGNKGQFWFHPFSRQRGHMIFLDCYLDCYKITVISNNIFML